MKTLKTVTIPTMKMGSGIRRLQDRVRTVKRLTTTKRTAQRLRVWRRNPHCAACGVLLHYPAFELDHITPIADGGGLTDAEVQVLCIACHKAKTAEEARQRAGGRRDICASHTVPQRPPESRMFLITE